VKLAEDFAGTQGGPRIRLVILVCDTADNEPTVISRAPRFVCRMTPSQAIALIADQSWMNFFVFKRNQYFE
jgi:hypothetical protein